jgi:NAD(P)-dependent dehydrogenase (short-subunit alcohol dehydrogenase family)
MIKKKNVLISGAGGFLGSNLCTLFSQLNFNIVCVDKDKLKIDLLKKKLARFKNSQYFFYVDITKEKKVINFSNILKKKKIFIDILINNAANNPKVKKTKNVKLMKIYNWQNDLNVGLMGTYILTKTFVEHMKKKKSGSIINIGSDLSILSPNHEIYKFKNKNFLKPISYSVIKHGLLGLNKYFATLYAKERIISNVISPGPIDNNIPNYLKKKIIENTPMKKLCTIEEVFKAILFFCDTNNRHITGQNIIIDGGKSLI